MKNIWIFNHYATSMYEQQKGRHFHFASRLNSMGYNTTIVCASFRHKSTKNYINEKKLDFVIKYTNNIRFVFIHVDKYQGNGLGRIRSMLQYTRRLCANYRNLFEECGKPDVILGSSVHPLACYAALKISKKLKCKNILEFRDLWPETLVMMNYLKEKNPITCLLYKGEKMLYKKADQIIFTMEGGYQYIVHKGWDKAIEKEKIHYINNGIDIKLFDENAKREAVDKDLNNKKFKVIYTGTIAAANDCKRIVKAGMGLKKKGFDDILFILYGDGEERERLEKYCREHKIDNVKFKGFVNHSEIPSILSKADVLIVNYTEEALNSSHNVFRYGMSHNKIFEYLAAAKPILYTQPCNYNIVKRYKCGVVVGDEGGPKSIEEGVLKIKKMDKEEYNEFCERSRKAAFDFDFDVLTKKLVDVIECN